MNDYIILLNTIEEWLTSRHGKIISPWICYLLSSPHITYKNGTFSGITKISLPPTSDTVHILNCIFYALKYPLYAVDYSSTTKREKGIPNGIGVIHDKEFNPSRYEKLDKRPVPLKTQQSISDTVSKCYARLKSRAILVSSIEQRDIPISTNFKPPEPPQSKDSYGKRD